MIFERALRRELYSAAGGVLTTLLTITITFMLIRILGEAAGGKVSSSDVLILIGFSALDYLPIILILTGFIAVLLVMTRAYQDSEMVVWFASGVSLTRFIQPVLGLAIPFCAVIGLLSMVVSPWANDQKLEVRSRYEKKEDIAKVAPGKFQESKGSGRVSFVEEVSSDLTTIQNVFTHVSDQNKDSLVIAKEGKVEIDHSGDRFLVMRQGRRYDNVVNAKGEHELQVMQFEKYAFLLSSAKQTQEGDKQTKALPLHTLIQDPNPVRYGELLWRVSLPIMGFLLIILAIPLGFVNPRVGRSANLIAAIIIVMLNLNALNYLQLSVVENRMSFWKAMWPMHLVMLSLILIFFMWRQTINHRLHPKNWLNRYKSQKC